MSIQSEIDRLSGNVAAALSAIEAKGVTVPAGSTSDALASLIEAIPAGSSVEMCTVKTTGLYAGKKTVWTTVDENGQMAPRYTTGSSGAEILAVCGSCVLYTGTYLGRKTSHGSMVSFGNVEFLDLSGVPGGTVVTVTLTQD